MKKEYRFSYQAPRELVMEKISEVDYVFPKLFPPVKEIEGIGNGYKGSGKFLGMKFTLNIYKELSNNTIKYSFTLTTGGKTGRGELTFEVDEHEIVTLFSYEGWMEKISGVFFIERWFDNFSKEIEIEIKKIQ
ncbi:hypothetical protein HS7_18600 [Sulfolobales archaeon HS-7]|nr:hypothetical protein HS7_18600 [Sulfolobales archaeon HS-7]